MSFLAFSTLNDNIFHINESFSCMHKLSNMHILFTRKLIQL